MKLTARLLPFTLLFGLAGCEDIKPISAAITPRANFDLLTKSDTRMVFNEGQAVNGIFEYDSTGGKVTLHVNGEKAVFAKAKYDKNSEKIISLPEKSKQKTSSGERVGFQAGRQLLCNPQCERVYQQTQWQSCTYYEQRPVTRCYPDGHGGQTCQTEWQQVPVQGQQQVEVTTTERDYQLLATIYGEHQNTLADISGIFTTREQQTRPLTACGPNSYYPYPH